VYSEGSIIAAVAVPLYAQNVHLTNSMFTGTKIKRSEFAKDALQSERRDRGSSKNAAFSLQKKI
jgi:hypothetical protein